MSYTLTFDASHKVKSGGSHVKGFFRHVARDADERQGIKHPHSNKNLDAARTHLNITEVPDGSGGWRRSKGSAEVERRLKSRLRSVKGKLRKDAVVMRPFVLQVDPKWYDEHSPDWRSGVLSPEAVKYHDEMRKWVVSKFGEKNVLMSSLHLDEYAPQLHVAFTPITDDGRLSQKDFFTGPKSLGMLHTDFRRHMQAAGLDVDMRRTQRSTEHLSSAEYQAKADRVREAEEEAEIELGAAQQVAGRTIDHLTAEAEKIERHRQAVLQRGQELDEREKSIDARERAAEAREADLRGKFDELDGLIATTRKVAQKAAEEVQRMETIPSDADRYLDATTPGSDVTLRERMDRMFEAQRSKRSEKVQTITSQADELLERSDELKRSRGHDGLGA